MSDRPTLMQRIHERLFGPSLERVEPLEGTSMSLFNSIIPDFWQQTYGTQIYGDARLAQQVWAAGRCQHMNSSQIAAMPLRFHGSFEPAWVSSPDPAQFPNGIGDAMYAIVDQLYGWGWSLQYVTDFYADGFPRRWTVIPSGSCEPRYDEDGGKVYKLGETLLDPSRVVQIDRNPTTAAHGTSALRAYAQAAYGLLAAGNQSVSVSQGGIPQAVLRSERKLTKAQAEALQAQWIAATSARNGAPPILPPELSFEVLSINPSDLSLLETQEWNARVIATAYGTPSVLLNMALQGGLTYQNPLALMQMWWLTELRTVAKRVVDAWSAQMLPRGSWVSVDASDITTELDAESSEDDPQLSQVAKASPAQQTGARPLTAIEGGP
jgi:hypothetical protein